MGKRKTKAERMAEWAELEAKEFKKFINSLSKVNTYIETKLFIENNRPMESQPGRRFYSDLDWFLRTKIIPDGAFWDPRECQAFLGLVRRFKRHDAAVFKPGSLDQWERYVLAELKERWPIFFDK